MMQPNALDLARSYIRRGYNPVPLPFKAKKPVDAGWESRIIDEASAAHFFNGKPQNVGIVLGPTSNGLTDVDLDCPEALALAPYLLPQTAEIFGRCSSPASHWLYITKLGETSEKATQQFRDPLAGKDDRSMLVELRVGGAKGAQTVFPGSVHESGEPIEWVKNGDPAKIDGGVLRIRVAAVAVGSLLIRHWPGEGARHHLALVLGGFLSRAGWSPEDASHFVGAVASAANDPEAKDRARGAEDAAKAHRAGEKAFGLPALRKVLGAAVADRIAEWLGYRQEAEQESQPEGMPSQPRPKISAVDITRWFQVPAPPTRFPIERIAPRGMVTLLAGDGGAGKTLIAQQAMTCVAAGMPFLGLQVEAGAAAGIFCEDPDEVLHSRQRRICEEMGLGASPDLIHRLRPASYLGSDVALWRQGKPTDFFGELERDLASLADLSLVVIDSASLVFSGNENDRGEVASFMMALNGMAYRLQAAFLLLSHTSKSQSEEASGMASGSTSWVWQARSALRLKVNKEGVPVMSHPKANHAKKIDPIELSWTENGMLTSSGVVQVQLPPKQVCRDILKALRQAWDAGKPWSPYVQAKKSGTYAAERISRQFSVEARTADFLVREWLNNDVLVVETVDARAHRAGLKVIGGID